MKELYLAQNDSPYTTLAGDINSIQTSIVVTNGSVLPNPPNLLTLGYENEVTEVVLMTGKTGNILTVIRGHECTPKNWTVSTKIARIFNAQDYNAVVANIKELENSSGSVESVNNQTGVVVLDTSDIDETSDKKYVTETEKINIGKIEQKFDKTIDNLDDIADGDIYKKSTNDYTLLEKQKLANIQENAEVNTQSDWNEVDENIDSFIKNKPMIPSSIIKVSELENDSNFINIDNIVQGLNITLTRDVVTNTIMISANSGGGTGTDGVGLQFLWNGTQLGVKREDEISYVYSNLKGSQGDTGLQGIAGNDGINGNDGRNIEIQNNGTYIQSRYVGDTQWINLVSVESLKGAKGDTGAQGIQGETGLQGIQGLTGEQGLIGLTGSQGMQGVKGDKGDKGDTGEQGIQGIAGTNGVDAVTPLITTSLTETVTGKVSDATVAKTLDDKISILNTYKYTENNADNLEDGKWHVAFDNSKNPVDNVGFYIEQKKSYFAGYGEQTGKSILNGEEYIRTKLADVWQDWRLQLSGNKQGLPATMTYNSTPNDGKMLKVFHGDDTNPTTDGTTSSVYIQRVDQSVTTDNPGNLVSSLYTTMKRKTGGTGWLYSGLFYLEDQSDTGLAQSVACAGMAYATKNSKVWGVYGDAMSFNHLSTITGGEYDATNHSGTDYIYDETYPVNSPFSCAIWAFAGGEHKNSFGIGVGAGTLANMFGAGLYIKLDSCEKYGIDIHARPKTLINFKYGASTDGTGTTPGGVGLDCGISAFYGQGSNQGAIHLRHHDICFGESGLGKIRFDANSGALEFWYNGARRGYLDCGGADHAM